MIELVLMTILGMAAVAAGAWVLRTGGGQLIERWAGGGVVPQPLVMDTTRLWRGDRRAMH